MDVTVAVLTIVRGRHRRLRTRIEPSCSHFRSTDLYVVVAMDGVDIAGQVDPDQAVVAHVAHVDGRLPLALARNTAAAIARERGADMLVPT
jgi:hypothetical protein